MIGEITDPTMVIELGMVADYDGDFWEDFPDAIEFALDNGHEHQLPKTAADVFLF